MPELKQKEAYLDALVQEIKEKGQDSKDRWADTIYFGGGTPSLLEPDEIKLILSKIGNYFKRPLAGQEITIEVNPEDITEEKLAAWKKLKINRISIGVQTLNDDVRKEMGRRLTADEVIAKIKLTINYFTNIGVDLIAGLPGDNVEAFQEGIRKIYKAGVNHISLYDLELDNGCQIARNKKKYSLLTEKEREEFLEKSWRTLDNLGFEQYEISNFSYDKKYSQHNLAFWNWKNYLGFGLGAASRIGDAVVTNTSDLKKYLAGNFVDQVEKLDFFEQAELNLMLAARFNNERLINDAYYFYEKSTGIDLTPTLNQLKKEKLLDKKMILTPKGRILYNQVMTRLLTE
jgi:oxygen-independent coproporphyrinogen-3 oxidase